MKFKKSINIKRQRKPVKWTIKEKIAFATL